MTNPLNRRQFIQLGGGAVVVAGLGACDRDGVGRNAAGTLPTASAPNVTAPVITTATTTAAPSTTIATTGGTSFDGRRLVVVQLNGGNDLLNSLPPTDSRYRDLRPTIAIPEADIVTLSGLGDAGLHPSLSGLARFWDVGQLALVRGIGFEVPNRSHFVSMDRWWRADQLSEAGWLGRVLDGLPAEPSPLFATALGGGAPLLNGRGVQPTVITSPGSFRWVGFDPRWLSAMGDDGADLAGMAVTRSNGRFRPSPTSPRSPVVRPLQRICPPVRAEQPFLKGCRSQHSYWQQTRARRWSWSALEASTHTPTS